MRRFFWRCSPSLGAVIAMVCLILSIVTDGGDRAPWGQLFGKGTELLVQEERLELAAMREAANGCLSRLTSLRERQREVEDQVPLQCGRVAGLQEELRFVRGEKLRLETLLCRLHSKLAADSEELRGLRTELAAERGDAASARERGRQHSRRLSELGTRLASEAAREERAEDILRGLQSKRRLKDFRRAELAQENQMAKSTLEVDASGSEDLEAHGRLCSFILRREGEKLGASVTGLQEKVSFLEEEANERASEAEAADAQLREISRKLAEMKDRSREERHLRIRMEAEIVSLERKGEELREKITDLSRQQQELSLAATISRDARSRQEKIDGRKQGELLREILNWRSLREAEGSIAADLMSALEDLEETKKHLGMQLKEVPRKVQSLRLDAYRSHVLELQVTLEQLRRQVDEEGCSSRAEKERARILLRTCKRLEHESVRMKWRRRNETSAGILSARLKELRRERIDKEAAMYSRETKVKHEALQRLSNKQVEEQDALDMTTAMLKDYEVQKQNLEEEISASMSREDGDKAERITSSITSEIQRLKLDSHARRQRIEALRAEVTRNSIQETEKRISNLEGCLNTLVSILEDQKKRVEQSKVDTVEEVFCIQRGMHSRYKLLVRNESERTDRLAEQLQKALRSISKEKERRASAETSQKEFPLEATGLRTAEEELSETASSTENHSGRPHPAGVLSQDGNKELGEHAEERPRRATADGM